MEFHISQPRSSTGCRLLAICTAVALTATTALADGPGSAPHGTVSKTVIKSERYVPTIWVDPDGCEHWVMDDGFEGYMTPNVDRNGIPKCQRGNICNVVKSDELFATDSATVSAEGKKRLADFFRNAKTNTFSISGHTDSRASVAYNQRLSVERARSVAAIAKSVGAKVNDVRGYGERLPVASNKTSDGMARNRRVEILCVK